MGKVIVPNITNIKKILNKNTLQNSEAKYQFVDWQNTKFIIVKGTWNCYYQQTL